MATNYDPVTSPTGQNPQTQANQQSSTDVGVLQFPYPDSVNRLQSYDYNENLFLGNHFDAFRYKINSDIWSRDYQKMRYIVANFAGLVSKIAADFLFIEPPKILVPDGDQNWIDELYSENKMRVQHYESAISNSYRGDSLFKIRVGKDNDRDEDDEPTILIDQVSPRIYFPVIDPNNVKGRPIRQELAWIVMLSGKPYLRKEIHTAGTIYNELWLVTGDAATGYKIQGRASLTLLGTDDDGNAIAEEVDTGIDRSLLIHIPNWRPTDSHFGLSDYNDVDTLFFAINNRITKIDNILDKHSDPILAIPEGILDENGKVRKERLGLFERPEDGDKNSDPSYITWDANLQSAFTQIDKLVEMAFMMSETAPDALGMGKGMADSGRALKFKLIRTLARVQRKQLYYREAMIEMVYVAQLLAAEHGLKVNGLSLSKDPVKPEIVWSDGLPKDMTEQVAIEVQRIDAGISTKVASIMRLDDVDEPTAKQQLKDIEAEQPKLPAVAGFGGSGFGKGINATSGGTTGDKMQNGRANGQINATVSDPMKQNTQNPMKTDNPM